MYYIFKNKFYGANLVGLLVAVALSAGCCVARFDEGILSGFLPRDTERFFWGFTDDPNERISIQTPGP